MNIKEMRDQLKFAYTQRKDEIKQALETAEITAGSAQQRRWRATRDSMILKFVIEIGAFAPRNIVLSKEALKGFSYLVDRKSRSKQNERDNTGDVH